MNKHVFGTASLKKLETCHVTMQDIAERALELSPYDFTIIHGWRGEDVQNALFDSGASKVRWPDSKHNYIEPDNNMPCSLAIDFGPWVLLPNNKVGIPWPDTHIFAAIAGCFFAAAHDYEENIVWGGDWDSDGSTKDQKLLDWGHVHLVL